MRHRSIAGWFYIVLAVAMAGLALALFLGRVAAAGVTSVTLSATPEAIPANGETGSTVVATVYDNNSPVVGQTVYFAATVYDKASQQVNVTVYLNPSSALTTSPYGQATTVLTVYEAVYSSTIEGTRVQVTATAGTVTATVYVGLYNSPHGRYTQDTNACFLCHGSHSASTPRLLKVSDSVYDSVYDAVYALPIVAPLCLSCHDGTGSQYNVKSGFLLSGENASHHPVRGVDNPAAQYRRLMNCTACHNVHGDSKPGGGIYPRLLRQLDYTYTSVGTKVYEGPKFCLTCHGPVDRYWGGKPGDTGYYDYYTAAAGDHSNEYAVHYETSGAGNRALLLPSSGTKVTCVRCHDQHAASGRWLAGGEESVCFSCHNSTGASLNGINIQERFNYSGYDEMGRTGSSRHDIYSNTGAKVECTSCHGPHTVSAVVYDAVYSVSDISDPENTKKYFAQVVSDAVYTEVYRPGVTVGSIVDFCLRCHDGTPPAAVNKYAPPASRTQFVPYTILFPSWVITTNAGGWNKLAFTQSGHYNYTTRILCTTCHDPHGTQNPRLLTLGEDTSTANGQCLTCHDGNNANYPGARDVKTDLTKSYRHVTLYVYGKHSDREEYDQNIPTADRHAECADCHDVHASRTYASLGRNAPNVAGPNYGVRGAASDYTGVSSGSIPVYSAVYSAVYEYDICFKCHTAYSWGGSRTGPVVPSEIVGTNVYQPDKGMEFNPANPSFHPVVSLGRNGSISAGAFSNGFSDTSRVYCGECHGSNDADNTVGNGNDGPWGAHGSTFSFLLKRPVTRIGGGGVTANELCFRCHGKGVYYDGDMDGGNNHYTRFAGTVSSSVYCSADTGGRVSLHCYHVKEKERPCLACHASHGTMKSAVSENVYDSETGYYYDHESLLSPTHDADCQTPENCWRGTRRLLAFRGAASVTQGVYAVRWNRTTGGPNRCYAQCHTSNPRDWTPAYGYNDR